MKGHLKNIHRLIDKIGQCRLETKVMLVTNKNAPKNFQKLSITLNWHTLEQVKSMHYLGLDVDENLTMGSTC